MNERKSIDVLKEVEAALSEIAFSFSISFLDMKVINSEHKPSSPQYNDSESNDSAVVKNPGTGFGWSVTARSIGDEIALLAECETTELDEKTSIFALGLDSIDIIKLSSRLKRRAINLSVSMIMQNATILQMSQAAEEIITGTQDNPRVHLEVYEGQLSAYLENIGFAMSSVEAVLPPTPIQEAIFADTFSTKFTRYLNQEVFKVRSSTDVKKLELAWKSVIDQSPILRTSCFAIDDPEILFSYAQIVHRPGLSCVRRVSTEPTNSIDAAIETVMKHDKIVAFKNVPFRLTLIRNIDTFYMVLTISHALYDGISLSLLHDDISDAYYNRFAPRPSYRDTLEHILGSSDALAARYWTEYMSGAKSCSFLSHLEKPLSHSQVNRIEYCSSISAVEVRSFARGQGISIQALGQVCWSLLLGYYLKTLEVTFGVMLSGRDTEQSHKVMLPTMNTIVVRSVIGGSLRQMLQDMQGGCINAVQYQHYPLRKSLIAVQNGGQKLFDSLFIVQRKTAAISDNERLYDSTGGKSSVEVILSLIDGVDIC